MKTTNMHSRLAFKKANVTELNDNLLDEINGGSTIRGGDSCTGCCCLQISILVLQQI